MSIFFGAMAVGFFGYFVARLGQLLTQTMFEAAYWYP